MSFSVKGKQFNIKKNLTLGEHRKINGLNARLNRISNKIKETTDEDVLAQLNSEIMVLGDEQLETICEFLEVHLGTTQDEINNLSLEDAIEIFQETYKKLSTVDKDIKKT